MSTAMPVLTTERLVVRPFVMEDLERVNRLQNAAWDEDVPLERREAWLRWSISAHEQLAELMQPPYGDRAITLRDGGELVGVVGLVPSFAPFETLPPFAARGARSDALMRPELGLYWAVDPAHQGHGYAPEAARAVVDWVFGNMSARAIVATTEYDNARSIAVMRKLGMRIERNPRGEPEWFQVTGVLFNPAASSPPPEIRTQRLILRPWAKTDLDAAWGYQQDPDHYTYLQAPRPETRDDAERLLGSRVLADGSERAEWAVTCDGAVVGDAAAVFDPWRNQAEVSYGIAREHRGKGFATEAATAVIAYLFQERGLDRVDATADARNAPSCRVLEKAGMTREGTRRMARVTRGDRSDEALYAILREEFERA